MIVLAVGAHPDDVELGAGGTLAKHTAGGDDVFILTMSQGAMSRDGAQAHDADALRKQAIEAAKVLGARVCVLNYPDQRFDTVDFLNLVKAVETVVKEVHPDRVYTHYSGDLNFDHQLTHSAVVTACRPSSAPGVKRIDCFEVPSATEWGTSSSFKPTMFVDISGPPLERKLEALSCYPSEMRAAPHPRSVGAIKALAQWRGASSGVIEAEAFSLVREIR